MVSETRSCEILLRGVRTASGSDRIMRYLENARCSTQSRSWSGRYRSRFWH